MGAIHTNTFSWHSVYLTICRENSLQPLCLSSPSAAEKCAMWTALKQGLSKTTEHTLLLTPLLPRMIFIFSIGAFRHLAVLSWVGIICEERKGKMSRRFPAAQQDNKRSLHFLLETPCSWNKLNMQQASTSRHLQPGQFNEQFCFLLHELFGRLPNQWEFNQCCH